MSDGPEYLLWQARADRCGHWFMWQSDQKDPRLLKSHSTEVTERGSSTFGLDRGLELWASNFCKEVEVSLHTVYHSLGDANFITITVNQSTQSWFELQDGCKPVVLNGWVD